MRRCICVELDNDIDDFVAYKYLEKTKMVDYVVLSPYPETEKGLQLLDHILLPIEPHIIPDTDLVFVGGNFTEVAKYLEHNKLKTLIANGGFVGNNIEKKPLKKFRNKAFVRTFNFNMDVESTMAVLYNINVDRIILTGKNVCHDSRNTYVGDFWKYDKLLVDICKEYHVRETKLQHDILAFKEGYKFYLNKGTMFKYIPVKPVTRFGNKGIDTEWGSEHNTRSNIYAAIYR